MSLWITFVKSTEFAEGFSDAVASREEGRHYVTDTGRLLGLKADALELNGNVHNQSMIDLLLDMTSGLFQAMARAVLNPDSTMAESVV